jgi:hypothetical protein
MKKYIISEEEKRRILNMHKNAILKEQAAPTTQTTGGETVGTKLERIYREISALLNEGTTIIQKNKFLRQKGAKCLFSVQSATSCKIEIIDSANKSIVPNLGGNPYTMASYFQINTQKPYTESMVIQKLTKTSSLHIAIASEAYNNILEPINTVFTKVAPLLTQFLNTAINAFPDKPGTATFDMGGLWSTDKMITGYQNPASA